MSVCLCVRMSVHSALYIAKLSNKLDSKTGVKYWVGCFVML